MFDSILGNAFVKSYFKKALASNSLPHALLLSGMDGIGKSLFAQELATHLLQTSLANIASHPDFHEQRTEGKSALHPIEMLRAWSSEVYISPFGSSGKVFLIHDAHRMQPVAANALLKTLEEPAQDTTILLLTSAPQEILPTIASRCAFIRFLPLKEEEVAAILKSKGLSESFAKMSHGSAGKACALAENTHSQDTLWKILSERPNYFELAALLEKIEKEIETEDPLQYSLRVEQIFAAILMWHRDALAKHYGAPSLLFAPSCESQTENFELTRMERRVETARLAFSRNIRLSQCLHSVFKSTSPTN